MVARNIRCFKIVEKDRAKRWPFFGCIKDRNNDRNTHFGRTLDCNRKIILAWI